MKTNSFEEEIRRQLQAAEMKPRPEVWERLEGRLPKQGTSKRPMIWGLLGLLLCIGTASLWYMQQPQKRATTPPKSVAAISIQSPQTAAPQPPSLPEAAPPAINPHPTTKPNPVNSGKKSTPTLIAEKQTVFQTPSSISTTPLIIVEPSPILPPVANSQPIGQEPIAQLSKNTTPFSMQPAQTKDEQEKKPIARPNFQHIAQVQHPTLPPQSHPLNLSDLAPLHSPKSIDKKRWGVAVVAGSSALAYNSGLRQNDGRPLNPLRLNTTGIMEFKVVDSLTNQVVSVRNVGEFKDIAASGDVKEVKIVESGYSRFIGFDVQYRLNKRFSVESGLRLHRQNVSIYHVRYSPSQTFYSLYMNRQNEDRIGGVNYAVHVMEFPLMLNTYTRLGSTRSEGFLSIGATYRRWLFEERTTQFSTAYRSLINTNASLLNFNRYNQQTSLFYAAHNLGLRARIGYQYQLSDKLRLYAALHSQYLLRKMYRDTYYTGRNPLMVGFEVGVGF